MYLNWEGQESTHYNTIECHKNATLKYVPYKK